MYLYSRFIKIPRIYFLTNARQLLGNNSRIEDGAEHLRYLRDRRNSEENQRDGRGKACSNSVAQLAICAYQRLREVFNHRLTHIQGPK